MLKKQVNLRPECGEIGVVPRRSKSCAFGWGSITSPWAIYHWGNLHPPCPLHPFFDDHVWSGHSILETRVLLSPTSFHRWSCWSELPLPETRIPLSPTSSRRELWSVHPLRTSWGCSLAVDGSVHYGSPPRIITVSIKLLGDRDSSW